MAQPSHTPQNRSQRLLLPPRLGELEARIIETIWDRGDWLSTREVTEALAPERRLAYTTTMTVLVRLWKKGVLRRRKVGRAYLYHTVHTREEWTALRMSDLLTVANDRAAALSHFVSDITPSDIRQLRRLLMEEE
jgi:predicted transcriptional regulator